MKSILLATGMLCLGSLAYAQTPGNVSSNLVLWLKADGNVYHSGATQAANGQMIDKWDGAGGTTTDANQDIGGVGTNKAKPVFRNSESWNINYNPVISFNGTQRFKLSSATLAAGAANNSLYVVKATTEGTIFVQETAGAVVPKFNSDGGMTISKNAGWDVITGGGDSGGIPTLNSFTKTTGNVVKAYRDGREYSSITMSANPRTSLTSDNYIGERATCCNDPLSGNIAEIIGYNQTTLSGTNKSQIDSYLAIKYGITLDNSSGGVVGDYLAANGTIIWDASVNPQYQNNIVAVGRDDNSGLSQKQSHTYDDTMRVYLSNLSSTNAVNSSTFSSNSQFVIVGDNGERLTSLGSIEYPSSQGIYSRIEREWKITNTNFNGTFSIDVRLSNVGSVTPSDLRILIDADGDFSDATIYSPVISYSTGVLTITGLSTTEIPLNAERYMTIVSMNGATPLPVELSSFEVSVESQTVQLKWQTESEQNSAHFDLERSQNAKDWETFNRVPAAGNSMNTLNYNGVDHQPYSEISYYRLKQVDINGQFEYSSVRSANLKSTEVQNITIFPNPTTGSVTLESNRGNLESITIFDVFGKDVTSQVVEMKRSHSKVEINVSLLESGIYLVKTLNSSTRFIKQ
jgi:hypothetical protein